MKKLTQVLQLSARMECLTNLHIGGTSDAIGIGEQDNPILRHPVTREPYVPGSSFKGCLRFQLEVCDDTKYDFNRGGRRFEGMPCACGDPQCLVCTIFGCHEVKGKKSPTRLIMRDAQLSQDSRERLGQALPGQFSASKTEVVMDRRTQTAHTDAGARPMEFVPSGAHFDVAFSLRIFEGDPQAEFLTFLAKGFDLVEQTYLGGQGSRGYGRVAFTVDGKKLSDHLRELADG